MKEIKVIIDPINPFDNCLQLADIDSTIGSNQLKGHFRLYTQNIDEIFGFKIILSFKSPLSEKSWLQVKVKCSGGEQILHLYEKQLQNFLNIMGATND